MAFPSLHYFFLKIIFSNSYNNKFYSINPHIILTQSIKIRIQKGINFLQKKLLIFIKSDDVFFEVLLFVVVQILPHNSDSGALNYYQNLILDLSEFLLAS